MTCLREWKIAIPGMRKSLCCCHVNMETGDHESDFKFDYCDENENSNDHEHEKNIIDLGIELVREAER